MNVKPEVVYDKKRSFSLFKRTLKDNFTGVLVGYPFGGATYALWSPEAPFLIIAAAILATLGT